MDQMTNNDYRAAEGISRSSLWMMEKSPAHFKYGMEHPTEEDTPALLFGRAAHKYILEESTFFDEFAVAPQVDRRTKAGKEAWGCFLEQSEGLEVIDRESYEKIVEMARAIDDHPFARDFLSGKAEQSYFWTDQTTGEKCKVRPDVVNKEKKLLVDYKTTESCADGDFERSCQKYGYKFQAGMYTEGFFQTQLEQYGFAFVAQEKKAPYAVRIYICTPDFIEQGYNKFRELLGMYHMCKEKDEYPGYEFRGEQIVELLADDYE